MVVRKVCITKKVHGKETKRRSNEQQSKVAVYHILQHNKQTERRMNEQIKMHLQHRRRCRHYGCRGSNDVYDGECRILRRCCHRRHRHRTSLFRLVLDDDVVARYDVGHHHHRRRRFPPLCRLVNNDDRDNDDVHDHDGERRILQRCRRRHRRRCFLFWLVLDDDVLARYVGHPHDRRRRFPPLRRLVNDDDRDNDVHDGERRIVLRPRRRSLLSGS